MTAERGFRIYWGPTLENTLDFVNPVVGDSPIVWRAPRDGSTLLSNGSSSVAWVTGRYYYLQVQAKYFASAQWAGGNGLQAFMDWAEDSNPFTLVPNLLLPALTVPGCYLEGPFLNPQINQENDTSQTIQLQILHPTVDLGLAWRGLFFEYDAGGSLTDPLVYTYNRTSIGYEITWQGYIEQVAANIPCDGHYPAPFVTGSQTTMLQDAITSDFTFPEDLTNVIWSKSETTISSNACRAPDQNLTGDLVVESVTASAIHAVAQSTAISAGDVQTALVFVRPGGRFNVLFGFNDAANGSGGNKAMMQINLHTGVVAAVTLGTGVLQGYNAIDLANGWWMLVVRGSLGGAITTSWTSVRLGDGSGNFTYTGDGASGLFVWGLSGVHGAHKQVGMYVPSSQSTDSLVAPWTLAPQAQWDYALFNDFSIDTDAGQTYTVLQTGANAFTGARAYIVKNAKTFTALLTDGTSSVSSSVAVSSLNIGDTVEVFRTIDATGVVQIRVAINGGAEQIGVASSPLALPAAWHDQVLSIQEIGGGLRYTYGLGLIRSGPYLAGVSPGTIAAARTA